MWVTVSSPGGSPQSAQVGGGSFVLGRAGTCDLVIDDPHVSMRHARLDVAEGGVWLADLRSTNGTFVDGERLMAPVWLAVPSAFRVGQTSVSLTADEVTVVSGPPPVGPPVWAGPPTPPVGMPAVPPTRGYVANAGPVARGDVAITGGRDAAGRDLIIQEGFKLQTRMRSSAKNCIRLGCVLLLAGFGLFGYFVITWNNEIFDAVTDPSGEPPSNLPSPLPWLPLGAVLMFTGLVLVVTGLLIPRDRIVTRRDG
jgi:FHA domain